MAIHMVFTVRPLVNKNGNYIFIYYGFVGKLFKVDNY